LSEKEKYHAWLAEKKANGLIQINHSIDWKYVAEHYGAEYKFFDEATGNFHTIDWSGCLNKPSHEELEEFVYAGMNRFNEAIDAGKSRLISNEVDEWGNMIDEGHPDYTTYEERVRHVELTRKVDGLESRYQAEIDAKRSKVSPGLRDLGSDVVLSLKLPNAPTAETVEHEI